MSDQKLKNKLPTIHQTRKVASSRLFEIEALDLEFSNGEKREYERLVSRGVGAVLIVPILRKEGQEDTVLLIREYAAGTERYELAFPKGKVEVGEETLHAANREIMEEVGYQSGKLTLLKALSLAPGYLGHVTNIILAEDLSERREEGDEPEEIEVVPWKLSEIDQLIERDDFAEGRSVAAVYLLKQHLAKNP
ncbi:ADP compounds hydrolase NudE [Cocleimonas flava]|uniref:ADP-ribose diphosphatase n=1 Tax=Cocleimonas flava TaxID=634765 RepID=A0A4R1FAH5_9GAMM|nr:ADP compounds hydrolase NudE [Cocleimonas flava]TCJ88918.1 ADP-ribose diphosphatase [Cocleimonas flava]